MTTERDSEDARDHFREGVRHYEAGEFAEAERCFAQSLALDPGRASTAVRLASVRLKLGRAADALQQLETVLESDSANVDALGVRAAALATLGYFPPALEAVEKVLELQPKNAQAWTMRGNLLRELGRFEEASRSFANAVEGSANPEVMSYYAAASDSAEPPPTAPRAYVQSLFDGYAARYDAELVDTLNYRAPQLLVAGLEKLGRRYEHAVDLGCGTGLCAPLLKPLAATLDGVDLSPGMVELARPRGMYDSLHVGDIVEFLDTSTSKWDLAVAADVFVYVGRLEPVFAALAPRMPSGGVFCFSVEAHDGPEPLVLRPTRRYAHSQTYLEELAAQHGFTVIDIARAPIRDQRWQPITGLCAWMERHGS